MAIKYLRGRVYILYRKLGGPYQPKVVSYIEGNVAVDPSYKRPIFKA